jgi:diguanylate cyclase (GGDEF)-like protein
VFQQVLGANRDQLAQAATITAADFGFRSAVALKNRETISSALGNQADRIHAKIAFLVSLDGSLLADSRDGEQPARPMEVPGLFEALQQGRMTSGLYMIDKQMYQLVAVPVKAPLPLAWIIIGSPVDDELAAKMRGLTAADVSFLGALKNGSWQVFASSLPHRQRQQLVQEVGAKGTQFDASTLAQTQSDTFATRTVSVGSDGNRIVVVLQRSLDQALAPYRHLQSVLFVLTLIGLAVSVAASVLTARGVVKPVMALIRSTRRIAAGEYSRAIPVTRHDELGELASAFNQMRQGIAEREAHILNLAYEDALTGLPNRAMFNDRLAIALGKARTDGTPVALLMIDLDRFKFVNDTLGHDIGDLLLRQVGTRMSELIGDSDDLVARLGGDEFGILLNHEDFIGAQRIAERLLKALEQPFSVAQQTFDMTGSIGIVAFPEHGGDINTLLRHADIAMYAAKRTRSGFAVYQTGQDEQIAEHLSLMSEMRRAVENDELVLHYQPKMSLASGSVQHVEALVRWNHPKRGLLAPIHFIPFAEQTGYVKMITNWVLNKAIAQCATWESLGLSMQIAVNVSVRDLVQPELPQTISAYLSEYGVSPDKLWIEITESALMDDPAKAIATLHKLSANGIHLSIDDFGTGYSSLSYLKRMPVHELKIDKSFVLGMAHDLEDETIVRSTIDLGHNMGLKVVAEGVESLAVMDRLRHLGCDMVQGYFLAKGLEPAELLEWLAARERSALGKTNVTHLPSKTRR